eukprot:g21686.t1
MRKSSRGTYRQFCGKGLKRSGARSAGYVLSPEVEPRPFAPAAARRRLANDAFSRSVNSTFTTRAEEILWMLQEVIPYQGTVPSRSEVALFEAWSIRRGPFVVHEVRAD